MYIYIYNKHICNGVTLYCKIGRRNVSFMCSGNIIFPAMPYPVIG